MITYIKHYCYLLNNLHKLSEIKKTSLRLLFNISLGSTMTDPSFATHKLPPTAVGNPQAMSAGRDAKIIFTNKRSRRKLRATRTQNAFVPTGICFRHCDLYDVTNIIYILNLQDNFKTKQKIFFI